MILILTSYVVDPVIAAIQALTVFCAGVAFALAAYPHVFPSRSLVAFSSMSARDIRGLSLRYRHGKISR